MVYAKYITRKDKDGNPVKFGPYYYKSVRTPDGKVKNIYLGSKKPKQREKKNKLKFKQFRDALAGVFM